jgi:AcrR family transcriptional regulator
MSDQFLNTDARERVLQAAEQLFAQKGYAAVTLREVSAAVGIKHASLYHHAPGGKEELFIEVTERHLHRHRAGLSAAIAQAQPTIQQQLRAAAGWLLSQPPMDLIRMTYSDMPAIDPDHAHRLSELAYASMIGPIQQTLEQARRRGEIQHHDLGLIAGGLLGMLESLYAIPDLVISPDRTRLMMAHDLIDVLLDGLRVHKAET